MQKIDPDELAFVGCKMGWIGVQKCENYFVAAT